MVIYVLENGGNTSWGTFGNCTLGCLTWMHWHPGNIKCAAGHYLFTFSATVSLCHHSCWPAIFPADCCSFHWWNEFSPFRPAPKGVCEFTYSGLLRSQPFWLIWGHVDTQTPWLTFSRCCCCCCFSRFSWIFLLAWL